ncbi:hypothetical protein DRN82_04725 [Thermococci archaeon]|nr:MAG: hypothetical protein DRN82_04725 [Thermococci archaeon]
MGKDFYIKIYESGHSHFYWKGKFKKRNAMRLVKLIKAIADFGSRFSILINYEEGLIIVDDTLDIVFYFNSDKIEIRPSFQLLDALGIKGKNVGSLVFEKGKVGIKLEAGEGEIAEEYFPKLNRSILKRLKEEFREIADNVEVLIRDNIIRATLKNEDYELILFLNPRKKEITDFIGWISVEKVKEIFNKLKEKGWKVPKVKDYSWLEADLLP